MNKSKSSTTKGPWRIGLPECIGVFSAPINVHDMKQEILLADCGTWRRDSQVIELEEMKANALLMTSAPELRDLLVEWRNTPFFETREEWEAWVADFGMRVDAILKRGIL